MQYARFKQDRSLSLLLFFNSIPGRLISIASFSLKLALNITSNTGDHMLSMARLQYNFFVSTIKTTSYMVVGLEKSKNSIFSDFYLL
jgi:hypothetical protein